MPTHLDVQVGDYQAVIDWNNAAITADMKLMSLHPSRMSIYSGYVVHNMEFAAWGGMLAANKAAALSAAQLIEKVITPSLLKSGPHMPNMFEGFLGTLAMAHIRFGMWDEILSLPFYEDRETYITHTAFLHYARGIAYGARSDLEAARREQVAFLAMPKPSDRRKHNVSVEQMAGVAEMVLAGEILYREGEYDEAFDALRQAVIRFDDLPYDEPHGWTIPVRQTLGALLAEQGHYHEAIKAYQEDLSLYPRNVWSLTGLKACYVATGDPRAEETAKELAVAEAGSDVCIGASCACALSSW